MVKKKSYTSSQVVEITRIREAILASSGDIET